MCPDLHVLRNYHCDLMLSSAEKEVRWALIQSSILKALFLSADLIYILEPGIALSLTKVIYSAPHSNRNVTTHSRRVIFQQAQDNYHVRKNKISCKNKTIFSLSQALV